MTGTPALEARELAHTYEKFQALALTSFALQPGEVVTLAGPNGAGKTTLLLCLSGLLRPSRGRVVIAGHDLYQAEIEAKRALAFVPDVPRFYSELTAWEHLQFIALAHGVQAGFPARAEALLREFGLWEGRALYPQNFSRGMRLKLGLLMALIRPFRVLLLDEPTSALDPEGVALVSRTLHGLRDAGVAIVLSSHSDSLGEMLAARRWHMQQGMLVTD